MHEALGVSLSTFMHAVVLMDRFMLTEHARVDRFAARLERERRAQQPHARTDESGADEPIVEPDEEACAPVEGEVACLPLVTDEQLQLVAMTSLLVAAKLVEDEPPSELDSLRRFCELAGHGRYHWTELRSMEAALCRRLRWRLEAPSPLGELRELVLRSAAGSACGVPRPFGAAAPGPCAGTASGWHSADEGEETDDSIRTDNESPDARDAAPSRARAGLVALSGPRAQPQGGAAEGEAFRRLHAAACALPLRARGEVEVASFVLQACLYSNAGLFDRIAPDVLAEAALRAAERHLRESGGSCGSPCRARDRSGADPSGGTPSPADGGSDDSSDGGESLASTRFETPGTARRQRACGGEAAAAAEGCGAVWGKRAELVSALCESMRGLLCGPFRSLTPLDGIKQLAAADANRWEHPRCARRHAGAAQPRRAALRPALAAARLHARPRPLHPHRTRHPSPRRAAPRSRPRAGASRRSGASPSRAPPAPRRSRPRGAGVAAGRCGRSTASTTPSRTMPRSRPRPRPPSRAVCCHASTRCAGRRRAAASARARCCSATSCSSSRAARQPRRQRAVAWAQRAARSRARRHTAHPLRATTS